MVSLIYFIIYLLNIIFVNSQDNSFISSLLKKYYPPEKYNKLNKNYNINFQIRDNNTIIKEFFVNTSYVSNENIFDFFYIGKLFYLNDTNLDLLSMKNNNYNWILLIKSDETFKNCINNNKSLIRHLTKVIILPKNSTVDIKIYAKFCLNEFPLYLIELEENLFNELANKYIEENNNNSNNNKYLVTIVSQKYELFPYIGLYSIILIISLFLFIFSFLYKCLIKKYEDNLKERQIIFSKEIQCYLDAKISILFLLFMELNFFYNSKGFIIEYESFLKLLITIFMIINKVQMSLFLLNLFSGIELIFLENILYKALNFYLNSLMTIFYILFNIFISPLRIPYAFYIINITVYMPIYILIIFYTIKNTIFFCKINSKIKKINRYDNKYGSCIRLKLCIVITQFLMFSIYVIFFFLLHQYLLFKQGLLFEIEKNVLFQCLDSCYILLISLVYMPRKWPYGFGLMIITLKETKKNSNKIKVSNQKYESSILKEELSNKKKIKEFIRKNRQKNFILLNPILFLKNNIDNDNNLLKNKIKIGKME